MRNVGLEGILLEGTVSLKETTAPTYVRANTLKVYAKDKSSISHLYYMDDALVEHDIIDAASVVHTLLDGGTKHSDTETDTVSRGSLIYGNSTPKWDELVIGAASTLLKSDGTDAAWGTINLLSAFHADTLTGTVVRGDVIVGNSTPKWARLAVGAANRILGSDGTDAAWQAQSFIDHGSIGGLTDDDHTGYVLRSILTTNGDLFTRAAGAIARLGIGSTDQVLTVAAGAPVWADAASGAAREPVTNGDSDHPEVLFVDGDIVMVEV